MASSASGQQPPKPNQHVELTICTDDDSSGRAARVFDEQEDDEARELLLDVADSDSNLAGAGGSAPPKIRVRELRKRAASTGEEILRGVHLDVPRGVVMGVIGPSGSGKSTLLRALNRLWEPAPGAVFLDGADVCGLDVRSLRRKVGMLFQQPAMFEGTYAYSCASTR
jgi:ABC-type bacteriocin/lantibiotic exporter with double-glycine peptidase domain